MHLGQAWKRLNYDTLILNQSKIAKPTSNGPSNLTTLCCRALVTYPSLAGHAVTVAPCHLAVPLLREAILENTGAVKNIISSWPQPVLRFSEVLPAEAQHLFQEEMGLDSIVFRGVILRTKQCRMTCMDFTDCQLNQSFLQLIVQMWPILSLKRSHRCMRKLSNIIIRKAGLYGTSMARLRMFLIKTLKELLSSDPMVHIPLLKNQRMLVKLDTLYLSSSDTFHIYYLITNCLRSITPVHIQVAHIHIRSELDIGDELANSLAPFIAFRGHDPETLEGIGLEDLEDNTLFVTSFILHPFTNISYLSLVDCNLSLQGGKTRSRTASRNRITQMFGCFHNLRCLDLSCNSFAGCLEELLEALSKPLECLRLRECDLNDADLQYLSNSQHVLSLRDLDLTKVCGIFPGDPFMISADVLLQCLKKFRNLVLLNLSQNHFTSDKVADLCNLLSNHWVHLKGMSITENMLSADAVAQLLETCCRCSNIQYIEIPQVRTMVELLELGQESLHQRIQEILERNKRTDIQVQIIKWTFAVILNI